MRRRSGRKRRRLTAAERPERGLRPGTSRFSAIRGSRLSWASRFGAVRGSRLLWAALLIGAAFGAVPAAASASSVVAPSVTLTSTAAEATGVTYLVDFTASGAPPGDTITVAAPPGTVFASSAVFVRDVTAGTALGYTSAPTLQNGGATATWTLSRTIPAGHRVQLQVTNVTNASTGTGQLLVSTSADASPAGTSSFSLTTARPASSAAVAASSSVASASGVTYVVGLTTSSTGALAAQAGTISVSLPTGTVIPNESLAITDAVTGQFLADAYGANFQNGSATATWTVDTTIPADRPIELSIPNVTNAGGTGGTVELWTSSDTVHNTRAALSLTTAQQVTSPTVTASTPVAGATGVTYLVDLTTSSTGALAAQHGTITMALPTGSVIPSRAITIIDAGTGRFLSGTSVPTIRNSGATATWTVGSTIPANRQIEFQIANVTNAPGEGGGVQLSTSSDTAPNTSASVSLLAAQQTGSPTLAISDQAATATGVAYTLDFTTSSTGGLAAGQGTITVALGGGTVIPTAGLTITDVNTGAVLTSTGSPSLQNGSATATWTVSRAIRAGRRLRLTISGVQNPPAGSYQASVSTSSDTANSTPTYQIGSSVPAPSVGPTVLLSSNAAGASSVNYTLIFTTSAALSSGTGTITVTAPSGTQLPASATLLDLTADQELGTASNGGPSANAQTYPVPRDIPAAHEVELQISGVTNPQTTSSADTVTVATSSQDGAGTDTYSIVDAGSVGSPSVLLSSAAPGATAVSYGVQFTTSPGGGLVANHGTVTVTAPAGTLIPNQSIGLFDLSADQSLGTYAATVGSNTGTWTVATDVPASHTILATITAVTNPASAGDGLQISTSSDTVPAGASGYSLAQAQAVSGASVALSSSTTGASGVSYGLQFTTSSTGGLTSGQGTITVSAPTGTVIPGQGLSLFDLTTDQGLGGTSAPARSAGNATATWTVATDVPANHTILATITGITNPTSAGNDQLQLSTSSDATPTFLAYSIVDAGPVGSPSVVLSSAVPGATAVSYGLEFTTSPGGGLIANQGTITVTAPAGTLIPNQSIGLFDLSADQSLGAYRATVGSNTGTWTVATDVPADHTILATITGITNPTAAGNYQLRVSTSSDPATANTQFFTIGSPQAVSSPTATLSTYGAGATQVTYAVGFKTSPSGGLGARSDTITLAAPAGTVFADSGVDLFDNTTNTDLGPTSSPTRTDGGATATWTVGTNAVPAGDQITLTATGVANPTAGTYQLDITTSSDTLTAQTASFGIGAGPSVTGLSPSSGPASGGTTVTITGTGFIANATTVKFGAMSAGNVVFVSSTQIIATAPAADKPGAADVTISTRNGTSATNAQDRFTYIGPPTAHISTPNDNQTYNLNQAVSTTFSCTDDPNGSGISTCSDSNGATGGTGTLNTSTAGPHTYTVTATSKDGQTATATIHYAVGAVSPVGAVGAQAPPAVTGGAPTSRTSRSATASGTVNPEGMPTQAYFQYGLDPSQRGPGASTVLYDQSTPPQQVGSDTAEHTITASLTGLIPGALYHVRLVAVNAAGSSFGQDRTFTTAKAAPPPPPVLGRSQDVKPVSGHVFIKTASGQFIPLTGPTRIPSGSQIDALHGSLQIIVSVGRGKTQQGTFGGAVFKLTQARTGPTNLILVEGAFPGAPSFAACQAPKAGQAATAALSSRTVQLLHASAHGRFRTRGRYGAATVRGTRWTIADRCDGTLTHDITDSVVVNDFVHHRTIILHPGQSYLARAR